MRLRFLLLLTIVAGLVTGCDGKQGVKVGDHAPGFSCTDINGDFIKLSQYKGQVAVLYFWSNSCCGHSLQQLEPFYSRNSHMGLKVVAVNVGNTDSVIRLFVKKNGLTFTVLSDEHSMISRQYGVFGVPTIFILDRDGVIREKIRGNIETAKLEKMIGQYL